MANNIRLGPNVEDGGKNDETATNVLKEFHHLRVKFTKDLSDYDADADDERHDVTTSQKTSTILEMNEAWLLEAVEQKEQSCTIKARATFMRVIASQSTDTTLTLITITRTTVHIMTKSSSAFEHLRKRLAFNQLLGQPFI